MPNLVGIGLSQVPTNSMLGGLAYQDPEHASIKNLDLKNLSQINSEIADTAVDVFVYDTSKDSDGGAWRKRTTHTSWYNETLGTATRGNRKEFPAVAVIVAETTQLTIYDGDDPNLPMWMVFNLSGSVGSACNMLTRGGSGQESDITSIACLNAKLVVGLKDVSGSAGEGPVEVNFIPDFGRVYREVGSGFTGAIYNLPISGRNSNSAYSGDYDSLGIIAQTINDVAMTVLPNAPIDSATGLPVPTIAVATDGGVSVIKNDGTVVDITSASGGNYNQSKAITITEENYLWWLGDYFSGSTYLRDSYAVSLDNFPSSDFTWNNTTDNLSAGTFYALTTNSEGGEIKIGSGNTWAWNHQERNALGGPAGLAIHKPNIGSETNSLIAAITSDYNTGYMHGNIKGAFLSDTDIEDGVELVSNGTFNTNTTGWTVVGGASATVSSGQVQLTNNGTTNSSLDQTVTTVVGKTYEISATITPQGGGPLPRLYVGNKYVQVGSNSNSAQTVTLTFLAYSTSTIVSINTNTNVNNAVTLADNVSMKLTNDVIGTNLIANGDFSTSSTAAFTTVGGGTAAVVSGLLRLTDTSGSFCYASAPFATVIGKQYLVSVDIVNSSNTANANYIRIGHSHNGTQNHNVNYGTSYGTKEIYITATATTTYLTLISGNGSNETGHWDNILIKPVQEDRSVNNKGLQVFGTITKTAVATGAELVAYSGFSASNHLRQPPNSDMNIGTGDAYEMIWFKTTTGSGTQMIMSYEGGANGTSDYGKPFNIRFHNGTVGGWASHNNFSTYDNIYDTTSTADGAWHCAAWVRRGAVFELYVDGRFAGSDTGAVGSNALSDANSELVIGGRKRGHAPGTCEEPFPGSLALARIGKSAPSAEQIKKIYEDEKCLFHENAACTLYGSSDAVTALAYDEVTDQLHVGTSAGRSDFQGLRRINNTTTAVTTAISAHDEFIIEQ